MRVTLEAIYRMLEEDCRSWAAGDQQAALFGEACFNEGKNQREHNMEQEISYFRTLVWPYIAAVASSTIAWGNGERLSTLELCIHCVVLLSSGCAITFR